MNPFGEIECKYMEYYIHHGAKISKDCGLIVIDVYLRRVDSTF